MMTGILHANQSIRAILLHQRPFQESSVIFEWVSESSGLVDTIARGIRRQRRNPDRPDLFEGWLLWIRPAKTSHLHLLLNLEPDPAPPERIRASPPDLVQASTFSRWLRANTAREYPSPLPYQLFKAALTDLAQYGPSLAQKTSFILKLCRIHGLLPDWRNCGRCHRPIPGEDRASLILAMQAIVCEGCASQTPTAACLWLSPAVRSNLLTLSWSPFHDLPASLRAAELPDEWSVTRQLAEIQDLRL
jgi:recombinational DNA repair protein (RecF pathway)